MLGGRRQERLLLGRLREGEDAGQPLRMWPPSLQVGAVTVPRGVDDGRASPRRRWQKSSPNVTASASAGPINFARATQPSPRGAAAHLEEPPSRSAAALNVRYTEPSPRGYASRLERPRTPRVAASLGPRLARHVARHSKHVPAVGTPGGLSLGRSVSLPESFCLGFRHDALRSTDAAPELHVFPRVAIWHPCCGEDMNQFTRGDNLGEPARGAIRGQGPGQEGTDGTHQPDDGRFDRV